MVVISSRAGMEERSTDAYQLAVFAGDEIIVHDLPSEGALSIGRAEGNDVRIEHPSVSRRHARIHVEPRLCVEDLGGSNGTVVSDPREPTEPGATQNLRQLSSEIAEINPGDWITFGSVMAVLRRRPAGPGLRGPNLVPESAQDPAMRELYEQASRAAKATINVLILGETGVGKEVVARTIHDRSPRANGPYLCLNCGALSESLLESELFGHEKGAFTGALQARPGLFESAAGGTVFLDEVGELPPSIQVKLLRVLEDRKVLRVGARVPTAVDVRFVAATNRDLEAAVSAGTFREDLFFRLNGISLAVPPLRRRRGEILPLALAFIERACAQLDRVRPLSLSDAALACFESYSWPGNVRELKNVIERAVVLCRGDVILPEHLPPKLVSGAEPDAERAAPAQVSIADERQSAIERLRKEVQAAERARIMDALEKCGGNQTRAASLLGISRRTLVTRLGELDIPRPRKAGG